MLRGPLSRRAFLGALTSLGAGLLAACSGPSSEPLDDPFALRSTPPPTGASPGSTRPASSPTGAAQPGRTGSATPTAVGTSGSPSPSGSPEAGDVGATPDPTRPARLSVGLDPAMPKGLQAHARRVQEQIVAGAQFVAADDGGDLAIVPLTSGASAGSAIVTIDYVAVVSRRLLVRDITFAQLQALWNGDLNDWSAVGSPVPHGVVRVLYQGSAGPLATEPAVGDFATIEDLAVYLLHERGALAIVPIDDVDFRMRTLLLDGVNYFRPGDAVNPLRVSFGIAWRTPQNAQHERAIASALADDDGPSPVVMTWAGDIIIARQVQRRINETGDWAAPFRSIYPELTWADITISNLETSLSDSFETILDPTTFTFKTDPPAIAGLQLAQIDVLSRANNHSFNYGAVGMDDTTAVLDAAGIKHFGIGHNLEESRRATVVELGGVTYAFLGYNGISDDWDGATQGSPGTNPMLDWLVIEDIQREVAAGHVVIPFFHWGTEYVYDANEEQRYFAHIAIDVGAAMVVGSHPHWVQAVETYKGRPIIYSLGNFVFDQEWSLETKQGMIAHVWMRGAKPLNINLLPILIEDYHRPRVMNPWEQWEVLEHIWAASDRIIAGG